MCKKFLKIITFFASKDTKIHRVLHHNLNFRFVEFLFLLFHFIYALGYREIFYIDSEKKKKIQTLTIQNLLLLENRDSQLIILVPWKCFKSFLLIKLKITENKKLKSKSSGVQSRKKLRLFANVVQNVRRIIKQVITKFDLIVLRKYSLGNLEGK